MWLLWNVWKREIERRVRANLIKGLAPDTAQYLAIEMRNIFYWQDSCRSSASASVLILIQQDCLQTYCLCLCPISWNCHKVTRFGGSIQLLFCSKSMQYFPTHLVLTIRPINCDVNCRWNFIISLPATQSRIIQNFLPKWQRSDLAQRERASAR